MEENTQVKYKCCSKCGENKPATKEFFYIGKGYKDGLKGVCKVCKRSLDILYKVKKGQPHCRWVSIMTRCYTQSQSGYGSYGGKGVIVCDEWKNLDGFTEWYNRHSIKGWEIDKDIVGTGDCYSPENCVFVPHVINMFFVFNKHPSVGREYRKYRVDVNIKGKTHTLSGDTEEDVLEQFYLFKELYLEKLVWEMKEEHRKLCEKYPNTPEISPKLLSILENFSTEEYLRNVKPT